MLTATFPQVQTGMCDKPRRCRSPQHKAARRSDHTDAESGAKEHLNKPNITDEMLIKGTRVGDARDEVIHVDGARSMNSPFPNRNRPLRAAIVTTTIEMVRFFAVILRC